MAHLDGTDDGVGYGVKGTGKFGVVASGTQVGLNAQSTAGEAAVLGNAGSGYGVEGLSATGIGVIGSGFKTGVTGASGNGDGVYGEGKNGVHGRSGSPTDSGVWGENTGAGYGVSGSTNSGAAAGVWGNNSGTGPGVQGTSAGGAGIRATGTPAGHFEGDVEITGNVAVGGSSSPNIGRLTVSGPLVSGIPQGQIIIDPESGTISVDGLQTQIEVHSPGQSLEISSGGISSGAFVIGMGFPDKNAITIDSPGGLVITSSLTVNGNAKFQGGKQGFLVDEFVNCAETVLERGDLLTLRKTEAKERYGDRIPVPQVELAREAYAVEVCGVVDGPVVQPEHRCHDAISAEVSPGARGLMVTIGCYADCKVDADVVPIEVGDLLTESSTPGHAQKVLDRSGAVGAIVGKALKAVAKGKATIPILVLLH